MKLRRFISRFYLEFNFRVWSLPVTLGYDNEDDMIFLSILFVHITVEIGPLFPEKKEEPLLSKV